MAHFSSIIAGRRGNAEAASWPAWHRLASAFLCPFLGAVIAAIILVFALGRPGDWFTASLAGGILGALLSARYLLRRQRERASQELERHSH